MSSFRSYFLQKFEVSSNRWLDIYRKLRYLVKYFNGDIWPLCAAKLVTDLEFKIGISGIVKWAPFLRLFIYNLSTRLALSFPWRYPCNTDGILRYSTCLLSCILIIYVLDPWCTFFELAFLPYYFNLAKVFKLLFWLCTHFVPILYKLWPPAHEYRLLGASWFHINGLTRRLVLTQSLKVIWKRPIGYL